MFHSGKVIRVSDGDTIRVQTTTEELKIRLFGIDCPEKDQPYGKEAQQRVYQLAFGKNVKVVQKSKDRYGRVVAEIMLPNGQNLNELLVKEGLAWHYTQYSNSLILAKLQREAKQQRRGLWADPNPVAPWEHRAAKRTNNKRNRN